MATTSYPINKGGAETPDQAKPHPGKADRRANLTSLVPIRNVEGGIISARHHRAVLIDVEGIDYGILDAEERMYTVEALAHAIHDQQKSPFMWFYRARRRSFAQLRDRLERRRREEPNTLLRNQFLPELRYLNRLADDKGVVTRRSVLVLTQPYQEHATMSARSLGLLNRASRAASASSIATSSNKLWQNGAWVAGALGGLRMDAHVMSQTEVLELLADELAGKADADDEWTSCVGELRIESDHIVLGRDCYRTILYAATRPRDTNPADLEPLVQIRHFDLALACHFQPVDDNEAWKKIQANQTFLLAARNSGRDDMRVAYNEQSAKEGEAMLAGQFARFFMSSLYVAVDGSSLAKMDRNVRAVEELMRVMRLEPQVLRWGQDDGLAAMLPIAENLPASRRGLPNTAAAVNHEFVSQNTACWATNLSSTYNHAGGVMLGTNGANGSTVIFDPWAVDGAAHSVVLAITGAGKTLAMIIECLRWLLADSDIGYYFIDPQGGTERFTDKVGGTFVRMGAGAIINPLDRREASGEFTALDEMISYLAGLFALMTGLPSRDYEAELAAACEVLYDHFEKKIPTNRQIAEACALQLRLYLPDRPGVLDQSRVRELIALLGEGWLGRSETKERLRRIAEADADDYRITTAVHYIYTEHKPKVAEREEERTIPILGDLIPYLIAAGAERLAAALGPYVSLRAYGKHYNGYTNCTLGSRLVSFSLFEVDEAQRPIMMYIAMKFIWSEITRQVKRRTLVVDEIGLMMIDDPAVAKWVAKMYKRARFLGLRMIAIDQNIGTFLGNDMGRYIIDNTSLFYLLRQARSGANEEDLMNQFHLTKGQVLGRMNAPIGNVLIVEGSGSKVTQVQFSISTEQLAAFNTRAQAGANLIHNREETLKDES